MHSARWLLMASLAALPACSRGPAPEREGSAPPAPPSAVAPLAPSDAGTEERADAESPPEPTEAEREATRRAEDLARRPTGDWRKFPLPPYCNDSVSSCLLPKGEPGLRCGYDDVCFNPCPRGLVPEEGGRFCAKPCRTQTDCARGTCVEPGYCDRWPRWDGCAEPSFEPCDTPDGAFGRLCNGKCVNACKPGHVTVGGTHCAKVCRSNADCGGYGCMKSDGPPYTCGGLCPGRFCPYPLD
jgi:hypothetical protein